MQGRGSPTSRFSGRAFSNFFEVGGYYVAFAIYFHRRVLNFCQRPRSPPSLRHTFSRLPSSPSRRHRFVRHFQDMVVRPIGFCRMSERERVGFSLSLCHTFSEYGRVAGRRFCSSPFPTSAIFSCQSIPVFRVYKIRASMTERERVSNRFVILFKVR